MTVFDQANQLEYDFEHATWSADHQTLNVWAGAEIPAGPNLGTGLGGGGTAAGTATPAGLITEPELASGTINHALSINLPCTSGAVYPAGAPTASPAARTRARTRPARPAGHAAAAQHERRPDRRLGRAGLGEDDHDRHGPLRHVRQRHRRPQQDRARSRVRHLLHQPRRPAPHVQLHLPAGRLVLLATEPLDHGGPRDPHQQAARRRPMLGPEPVQRLGDHHLGSRPNPAHHHAARRAPHRPATPPTTPVSTTPPATTPVTPTPTPVASAPVKPTPTPAPAKHSPKKKQPKSKGRPNLAHTASVSTRNCKTSKSRPPPRAPSSAGCATAVTAAKRHAAGRR